MTCGVIWNSSHRTRRYEVTQEHLSAEIITRVMELTPTGSKGRTSRQRIVFPVIVSTTNTGAGTCVYRSSRLA